MHVYLNQVHVFRTYLHVVHVNGCQNRLGAKSERRLAK